MKTSCAIAFKEWAVVCLALAGGRQSVILRKGGIAEENGTFKPEHDRFWLFPTLLHQKEQGVKAEARDLWLESLSGPPSDRVRIQHLAEVERVEHLKDFESVLRLNGDHIWTPDTVQQRFLYREPGLYVLRVKIHSLPAPVEIFNEPEYEGCRTWVKLKGAIEIDVESSPAPLAN